MKTPAIDIVRALGLDHAMALRAAAKADDGLGLLSGHFSKFDVWYEVNSMWEGNFLERVAPGAFAQTIAEDRAGMRVLFDHGYDPQIGNKVLGPIRTLEEDKIGPYYEVPLFDTTYNRDLLPGLKADPSVYGASFRFRVTGESWDDEPGVSAHNPKGIPERTITATRTMEFGPVTFPASQDATAGVRSLTDEFYDRLRQRDSKAYASAKRAAAMPTMDMNGGDGDGEAGDDDDETPGGLAAGLDAILDAAMAAHADGNTDQVYALVVAGAATVDTLLELLGVPDADEQNAKPKTGVVRHPAAPPADPTGQLDARSAGGGDEGTPEGVIAAPTPASLRHRRLQMEGII